jgi:hypothetical protein
MFSETVRACRQSKLGAFSRSLVVTVAAALGSVAARSGGSRAAGEALGARVAWTTGALDSLDRLFGSAAEPDLAEARGLSSLMASIAGFVVGGFVCSPAKPPLAALPTGFAGSIALYDCDGARGLSGGGGGTGRVQKAKAAPAAIAMQKATPSCFAVSLYGGRRSGVSAPIARSLKWNSTSGLSAAERAGSRSGVTRALRFRSLEPLISTARAKSP